jgi:DNA helicase-2/ATP-dependent DNA helicase PcrA
VVNYNQQESEYLQSLIANFRLSASALNTYIRCPLQFKFDYLLKVPHAPQRHMALGTSVHFAFENFYRQLKNGTIQELSYLLFLFEEQLKRELLGESDFALTLTEGRKILADYYNNYYPNFVAPVEIEYGFYGRNLLISTDQTEPIRLSGKLDKIEWLDQDHYTVKVIDYKVSAPKSANEIRGGTKTEDASIFRQLVFYKLLGDIDQQFRPSQMLPKYKVEQAEIDFIKPNPSNKYKRENFIITDQDTTELTAKIIDVMIRVRNLEFNGTEDYPLCEECEYCKRINH